MNSEEIRKYLAEVGLPGGDSYELPTSQKTFPDGAHFRTEELSRTVEEYERMFSFCDEHGYIVNKITDISGAMYDSDEEIVRKCELAREHGCELILGPGASESSFDISQQAEMGKITAGKLRGMDQVFLAIRSMLRAVELGCRGFILYDEGLLAVALKMRKDGKLPPDTKFKVSSNICISNPPAVKFWADSLGPHDGINPIRDLTLPMISTMREVTEISLDLHILWRGKIARIMEAPEIVRVGSPVYLKNAFGAQLPPEERCKYGMQVVKMINQHNPSAKQSKPGAKDLAIPARPKSKW
ncbi:MAG: hypothetical protein ACYTBX_01865 [Planctomycetota bacterium]|jgi:hypothetical protein